MRLIYDFECENGHRFEALVHAAVTDTPCRFCATHASRLLPAPRSRLEGITGAFPSAYDKWTRMHEQGAIQARERRLKNEGPDAS